MRALIVDDEVKSHTILQYLLETNHPEIDIIGNAYNVEEGLHLISRHQPDLVFLDIEMPDGSGFDLLKQINDAKFKVIFITAHQDNDYAITAFRFGGLDFLLKPIDADDLKEAIDRYPKGQLIRLQEKQIEMAKESKLALEKNERPSRLLIATTDEIFIRKVSDIINLQADKNYTTFHFQDNRSRLIASKNIGEYELQFQSYPNFMRIHKSHLINLNYVDKYLKGDAHLVMNSGASLPVSKNKRELLFNRLKSL